jgi:hypothetical protein
VVGPQFAVWNLRSEDPVWACLWWPGRGDRLDGVDGDLCNPRLCWCGLELRKCSSGRFRLHHCEKNTWLLNATKADELRLYRLGLTPSLSWVFWKPSASSAHFASSALHNPVALGGERNVPMVHLKKIARAAGLRRWLCRCGFLDLTSKNHDEEHYRGRN